jgi:2-dehydropantoate 2-reductase
MTNGSLAVVDDIKASLRRNGIENNVHISYACTTHGAIRGGFDLKDGQEHTFRVTHTGSGQTFIEGTKCNGVSSNNIQEILNDIWNDLGLNSSLISSESMYLINWKKLAVNCAVNPLTALRRCKNGDLLSNGVERLSYNDTTNMLALDFRQPGIFYRLIREVSDIALAEMERIGMRQQMKKQLRYDELVAFAENVVRQTSENNSSMLQDILAKHYPTEINYLNGFISRLGRRYPDVGVQANAYIVEEL